MSSLRFLSSPFAARVRTLSLAVTLLSGVAALAPACANEVDDGSAASTEQAYMKTVVHTITNQQLQNKLAWLGLGSASFTITNDVGTLTPPAAVLAALFPKDPDPAHHTLSVDVKQAGLGLDAITIDALHIGYDSAWLEGAQLKVRLMIDGSLTAQGLVHPKVTIKPSELVVSFATDGNGGLAFVGVTSSNFSPIASECGLLGWCNALAQSEVDALKAKLFAEVDAVGPQYVNGPATQVWQKLLTSDANGGWTSLAKSTPLVWFVQPSGQSIGNATITYSAIGDVPAPLPTNCTIKRTCTGLAGVCDPSPVGIVTKQVLSPTNATTYLGGAVGPTPFEFCAGDACTAPVTIDVSKLPYPQGCGFVGGGPVKGPPCALRNPAPGCVPAGGGGSVLNTAK
jgi:hypothetical protein